MLSNVAPSKVFGSSERPIPAVVIGGELNGLGVCRSLAIGGMPVYVVDCERSRPALWSRYATPVLTETLHGPAFVGEPARRAALPGRYGRVGASYDLGASH
jgi:hypothetical protein